MGQRVSAVVVFSVGIGRIHEVSALFAGLFFAGIREMFDEKHCGAEDDGGEQEGDDGDEILPESTRQSGGEDAKAGKDAKGDLKFAHKKDLKGSIKSPILYHKLSGNTTSGVPKKRTKKTEKNQKKLRKTVDIFLGV